MRPDRTTGRLGAEIQKALNGARRDVYGASHDFASVGTGLRLTEGEWRRVLSVLKSAIGEDGPSPQMGGPHA